MKMNCHSENASICNNAICKVNKIMHIPNFAPNTMHNLESKYKLK